MLLYHELISIDKSSDTAIYLQISNSIINNIRRGRLRPGLKLPGSRELSDHLSVHRKTILAAYDELLAQGWIEVIPRKGTFVVHNLPEIRPQKLTKNEITGQYPSKTIFSIDEDKLISFPITNYDPSVNLVINDGFPDIRLAPIELYLRELRSISKQSAFKKYYTYGSPKGAEYLRETLAAFLSDTRGLAISTDNVMITKGAQMGIYLAGRLLIKPGDDIIVEEPGYFGATLTFQQFGANINRVPVDDFGIDVDAVEKLCKTKKIRFIYVIPHHHHPTTVSLIPERRLRLLELAANYKFAIIEDDYDYDYHYTSNPIMPMASLDQHGNVIYIGTLSKMLVPSIRVGFMVAPLNFIDAVAKLRRSIDAQGDGIMESAIAQLYRNGTITRHIKKAVNIYRERRDTFCKLLTSEIGDKVSFKIPVGGMSVWAKFNDTDLTSVSERAAKKGLTISNGKIYNTSNVNYNSCRLGFASLNLKEQQKAIEILARCFKD
jgi:GntR family transcriptional regulator/MocR family aminotransferase